MPILSCSPLSPIVEENAFPQGSPTFSTLLAPLEAHLPYLTPLKSGSNKPLTYTFTHQIRGLVYYHTIVVNLRHNPLWYSMLISQKESWTIFQPHSCDSFDQVL